MASKQGKGQHGQGHGSPNNGTYHQDYPPPERPKTPTTRSRIEEKNALISLNNRLASILERKSQLEGENSLLSKELVTERENTIQTLSLLQKTYDNELEDVRKLLQESDKERVRLELNQQKLVQDLNEANNRLDKKAKDAKKLGDKLAQAEDEISSLFSGLQKANADRDKLITDKRDLQDEIQRLGKIVEELGSKLENECMQKIEFQNQMDRQVEDFVVKKQIYEQEISNIKSHREVEIAEMDGRLKKEYESKLENDLQQLRDEYDTQQQKNKEAQEALYRTKEEDLRNQIYRLKDALGDKGNEVAIVTEKLNATLQRLSTLEGDNYGLVKTIKDLEKKLGDEREGWIKEVQRRDMELDELRGEKDKLIREYQDLWDTKVVLDNEIATYHMLLEAEERRLSQLPTGRGGGEPDPQVRTTKRQETKSMSKTKTSYTQI